MKCWGNGQQGQLGDGVINGNRLTPVTVQETVAAIAIAAGGNHTCAVLSGGAHAERLRPGVSVRGVRRAVSEGWAVSCRGRARGEGRKLRPWAWADRGMRSGTAAGRAA